MKNLIVQIFIPKKGWEEEERLDFQNNEVLFLSTNLVYYYAKKYDCDYMLINKASINFKHPTWERFVLFDDNFTKKYNNILYLDTDVFPWPDAPNIFNFIDNKKFNVVRHVAKKKWMNSDAFNAGVFCINDECVKIMKPFISKEIWINNFIKDPMWEDSKELNTLAQITNVEINWLDEMWNMKNDPNSYFTHLWGQQKKINTEMLAIQKARQFLLTRKPILNILDFN